MTFISTELTKEATDLLVAFETAANRGGLHPEDEKRWHAFLIRAHLDGSDFAATDLGQWLKQQGWTAAQAHPIVLRYGDGRRLLTAFSL